MVDIRDVNRDDGSGHYLGAGSRSDRRIPSLIGLLIFGKIYNVVAP